QDPAGNALRPALFLSQMPNPSRRKDWGDPRSLRIRRIELSEVRCGYDGLALAHWLRSFGLASSSADISAKNTSGSSPEIAESLRSLNTSPGSTGLGGVPIISTKPLGEAFVAGTMSSMVRSVRI